MDSMFPAVILRGAPELRKKCWKICVATTLGYFGFHTEKWQNHGFHRLMCGKNENMAFSHLKRRFGDAGNLTFFQRTSDAARARALSKFGQKLRALLP